MYFSEFIRVRVNLRQKYEEKTEIYKQTKKFNELSFMQNRIETFLFKLYNNQN